MTIHLKPMNGDCAAVLSKQTNNGRRRLLSCFVAGRKEASRVRRGGAQYGRYGRAICVKCGLRVGVVLGAYMGKGKEQSGKFIKCHCRFIKTRQKRRTRTTHTHTHTGIICVLCVCVCDKRDETHGAAWGFVLLELQLQLRSRLLYSPSTAVGVIYKSFLAVLWDFATVSFSFWPDTQCTVVQIS